jgi:hypothetical protein
MMREYVQNLNNAKAVFEYLKAVDLSEVDLKRDRPITEAYNEIKEVAAPIEHRFINDLTERYGKKEVNFTSMGLFQEFVEWKSRNGMTFDINSAVFCRKIMKLAKETELTHIKQVRTKKGNGFTIDMSGLRDFMVEKKYIEKDAKESISFISDVIDESDVKRKSSRI